MAAAARRVAQLGIEVVVTSPLPRVLETAVAVLHETPSAAVVIQPLLRERLGDSCDVGRSPSVLAGEFPMLDFAQLPSVWWHAGELDARGVPVESRALLAARMVEFRAWLAGRDERSILVVGHLGVLSQLAGVRMQNAELREWTA